jgi:PKD repeat protein
MFNAALRAGFQMGARYNHAYYITRYPVGLDATIWVSGNSVKNMTFTNDSKYPIVIRSINKKRSVTFEVWGVGDGRTVNLSDPVVTNETTANQYWQFTDTLDPRETERIEYGADGFDSIVNRTVRDASGNVIHSDSFRSDYRRTDGIVLVGRCNSDPASGQKLPLEQNLPPCGAPTPGPTPSGPPPSPGDTQPVAKFTFNSANSPTITFDASASTGDGLSYAWDFGDGGSDGGVSTSHEFAPGIYQVKLTVTDADGDTAVKIKSVTVGSPPSETPTPTPTGSSGG